MDVSIVRCKLNLDRTSDLCVKAVSLRIETKIDYGLFFLQLLATGLVSGCSSGSLKYSVVMNGSMNIQRSC